MAGEVKRIEILQVFKRLKSTDVEDLKFILRGKIVESVAEKIKTPLELLDCLEKLGVLGSADNLERLATLMVEIGRRDLAFQLTGKSYAVDLTLFTVSSFPEPNESGRRAYSDMQNTTPHPVDRPKLDANSFKENKARGTFFDTASMLIGPFWTRFARCSGLDQPTVDGIDRNERTVQERALKLLDMMWQAGHLNWPIMEDMLRGLQKYQIIRTLDDLRKELEKANDGMEFFKIVIDNKAHQTTVGDEAHSMEVNGEQHQASEEKPNSKLLTPKSMDENWDSL